MNVPVEAAIHRCGLSVDIDDLAMASRDRSQGTSAFARRLTSESARPATLRVTTPNLFVRHLSCFRESERVSAPTPEHRVRNDALRAENPDAFRPLSLVGWRRPDFRPRKLYLRGMLEQHSRRTTNHFETRVSREHSLAKVNERTAKLFASLAILKVSIANLFGRYLPSKPQLAEAIDWLPIVAT